MDSAIFKVRVRVSVFKRKTMLGTHTLQYSPLIFQLSYERRQIAVK